MTLCIAAIADGGAAIVTVSDTQFDLGYTSGDGIAKIAPVAERWGAMFAGQDVTSAPLVLAAVSGVLRGGPPDADQSLVQRAFVTAYHQVLTERIEGAVLSRTA